MKDGLLNCIIFPFQTLFLAYVPIFSLKILKDGCVNPARSYYYIFQILFLAYAPIFSLTFSIVLEFYLYLYSK